MAKRLDLVSVLVRKGRRSLQNRFRVNLCLCHVQPPASPILFQNRGLFKYAGYV
jgi:hypothetical protein